MFHSIVTFSFPFVFVSWISTSCLPLKCVQDNSCTVSTVAFFTIICCPVDWLLTFFHICLYIYSYIVRCDTLPNTFLNWNFLALLVEFDASCGIFINIFQYLPLHAVLQCPTISGTACKSAEGLHKRTLRGRGNKKSRSICHKVYSMASMSIKIIVKYIFIASCQCQKEKASARWWSILYMFHLLFAKVAWL